MAHDHHPHDHPHHHPHHHVHASDDALPEHLDLAVPDDELSPAGLGRRTFLRSAGVLGTAAAAGALAGAAPAAATAPAQRRVPRGRSALARR
jgi:hypothetical protein